MSINNDFHNNEIDLSDDDYKTSIEFDIKTLNPEKDLFNFLSKINFKLTSNDVKYPKVRKNYIIILAFI